MDHIKKITRSTERAKAHVEAIAVKAQMALKDKSGQLAADHAGWIAVAFVLIGVVLYFTYPLMKDTILPAIKDKFMGFLNYNG